MNSVNSVNWSQLFLAAVFVIPLHKKGKFQELVYHSLPKHKIEFSNKGMKIKVDKSAMPLIYPLDAAEKISAIKIKGHVDQLLKFLPGQKQGSLEQKSYKDDYVFRLGLVLVGDKTLNWFQKKIAPQWVLQLYALAPEGEGIDRIQFYNLTQQKKQLHKEAIHPLGKRLIYEKNQWYIDKPGDFELNLKFSLAQKVHAFWLSLDGDDTQSQFTVVLKEFSFVTPEKVN